MSGKDSQYLQTLSLIIETALIKAGQEARKKAEQMPEVPAINLHPQHFSATQR